MKKALKRSLSILLAITIILSSAYVGLREIDFSGLFAIKAKAIVASGTWGDNLTWSVDSTGLMIISGSGKMDSYLFSTSSSGWHTQSEIVNKIVVENGVTSISPLAFEAFSNVLSVTLPNSITVIGTLAFKNCTSLTSVVIPESVTKIDVRVFYDSSSLETVYYGGSEEDWNNISIGWNNQCLTRANIIFNCKIADHALKMGEIALSLKILDNSTKLNGETVLINGKNYDTGNGTINLDRVILKEENTISVVSTASEFYEQTFKLEHLDDSSETIFLEKRKATQNLT